ncbi:MAG TPA: 4Fe-4S binding protein [Thermoplasmata archaeon]|nr:4Fe-4S binding protein [Thermoplasmata archaeon]
MSVRYEQRLCDRSPYCPVAKVCPTGAFHIDRKTFTPSFDSSKCTGCGVCVPSCPHGAVAED